MQWAIDHRDHILTVLFTLSEVLGLQKRFKTSSISGILVFIFKAIKNKKEGPNGPNV